MKKLVCEMCGSSDMLKQDGVFVCQNCGTKYSVEEARKMMVEIEGTVEVQGTVKVDRSNEIANRMENIKNEFNSGNNDTVKRMCTELLNIDPDNYQAIMYGGLAEGWQSSIGKPQIVKASNELQRAVKVIRKLHEDDESYTSKCIELMQRMRQLAQAMINLYIKQEKEDKAEYDELIKKCEAERKELWRYIGSGAYNIVEERAKGYLTRAEEVSKRRVETYNTGCASVCRAVNNLVIEIINNIQDNTNVCSNFCSEVENCVKPFEGYLTDKGVLGQYDSILHFVRTVIAERALKETERLIEKIDAYWEAHPEEKAEYDSQLGAIDSQLEEAQRRIIEIQGEDGALIKKLQEQRKNAVPSEADKSACEEKIFNMEVEYQSLGLFKGKEKKALMEKIDAEKAVLRELTGRVKKEKKELEARIDAEINNIKEQVKPIYQKIAKLNKQREEVEAAFSIDID